MYIPLLPNQPMPVHTGIFFFSPFSMDTMMVDPLQIRFTHSKIRNRFSGNSMLIMDTFNQLKEKSIPITDIPMIQVMIVKNEMYSMNNRRLYMFKMLKREGLLDMVQVRVKRPTGKQAEKFNPDNCSLEAKMTMH